jgi:enterochelin esterase-like enzyme
MIYSSNVARNMLNLSLASISLLLCVGYAAAAVTVTIDAWYPAPSPSSDTTVTIAGTAPLDWDNDQAMQQVETDHWRWTVVLPTEAINATYPIYDIDFKIIVNGSYELGANHRVHAVWNQSIVNKTVYPYFQTLAGQEVTLSSVYSPQLNNTRDVWIYIPPAMVENTYFIAEYVLILHDGQNLAPLWDVSGHLDSLVQQELIEQIFIIGPYNTPDRIAEYTYSVDPPYGGGKGDQYLDFLQNTLVPLVASKFSILTDQANLAIGGSSLGGLISCYAGVTRPAVYSTAICMSSSFWWNNGDFQATIIPKLTTGNGQHQRYYVDSGDSGDTDDDMQDTTAVATAFITSGNGFVLGRNFFWYMQRGGQHNEGWWSLRFHHPMQYLYQRPAVDNYGQ